MGEHLPQPMDYQAWINTAFDKQDAFDFMRERRDMPNVPLVLSVVQEHIEKLVRFIDQDALAWCEYVCTRDLRCPRSNGRLYAPDQPEKVFASFKAWIQGDNGIILEQWGEPEEISVDLNNAPLAVRWAYGDRAEFKVREIDGQRSVIITKVWTEPGIVVVPEIDILLAYVRTEVAQAAEYAKTLLIPSRADDTVSGQMKIAVDVALVLPYVRVTDDVLVVGSANCNGIGESYHLLAGSVKRVTCVDPQEIDTTYEMAGTVYERHAGQWDTTQPYIADVVLVDAFSPDQGTIMAGVDAREYSLKRTTDVRDLAREWKTTGEQYIYRQLSVTQEVRVTSQPRKSRPPLGRLGDCAACREVDSIWPTEFDFSPEQRKNWRIMHKYGAQTCRYMQAPLVKVTVDTYLAYPPQVRQFIAQQEIKIGRYGQAVGISHVITESTGECEMIMLASPVGCTVVTLAGERTKRRLFMLGGRTLRLMPRTWAIWIRGVCVEVGKGFTSLQLAWRDKVYRMPFVPSPFAL